MEPNLTTVLLSGAATLISISFFGLIYMLRKNFSMVEEKAANNEKRIAELHERILLVKAEAINRDRLEKIEAEQIKLQRTLDRVCFKLDILMRRFGVDKEETQ